MSGSFGHSLDPLQLIEMTRFYADEVESGHFPYVRYNPDVRWHQRIYRDPRMDVWLISWLPSQGTQLHDHGGSSGAFTVLSGMLSEAVAGAGRLHEHDRHVGQSIGFGARYVHDVRNLSGAPALSVHAYSPPLTGMTHYGWAAGQLEPIATIVTDDPEPTFEARRAS
jgi:Cysteine dioxygenase type I